ncbi:MAG TPA: DUF4124 domain-containing protein [Luteimonas sp.]|nr:DUF4124 domain-containing protein [Luteimonas sp.]
MLRLAVGTALCLVAAAASAQAAYQWKDANGVTHYSSTPPSQGKFQVRTVNNQGASLAAAAKPEQAAEDPRCATARANLAVLGGKGEIQLDSNGDGKPDKTLSAEDRANQTALAEATLKTSCAATDAKKP